MVRSCRPTTAHHPAPEAGSSTSSGRCRTRSNPVMVQDAPGAARRCLLPPLPHGARGPNVAYFKVEVPGAAAKLRDSSHSASAVEALGGEEGITLRDD